MALKCDICEDRLYFDFKTPLVLSIDIIEKLETMKKLVDVDCGPSEIEFMLKLSPNFLKKNWSIYRKQSLLGSTYHYLFLKKHKELFDRVCIHEKNPRIFTSPENLTNIIKKCKNVYSRHQITYKNVYTRILHKIEISSTILSKHFNAGHTKHMIKLAERYFSQNNIIFHMIYSLSDNKLMKQFIDDTYSLWLLNFKSKCCIIMQSTNDPKTKTDHSQLLNEWFTGLKRFELDIDTINFNPVVDAFMIYGKERDMLFFKSYFLTTYDGIKLFNFINRNITPLHIHKILRIDNINSFRIFIKSIMINKLSLNIFKRSKKCQDYLRDKIYFGLENINDHLNIRGFRYSYYNSCNKLKAHYLNVSGVTVADQLECALRLTYLPIFEYIDSAPDDCKLIMNLYKANLD